MNWMNTFQPFLKVHAMSKCTEYRVIISDRAKGLMGTHVLFLSQVSPKAAAELKTALIEATHSLSSMPERCPFFNEQYIPANRYHKLVVNKNYLIIYQIKDSVVFVEYILDCRQDYQWLIHQ